MIPRRLSERVVLLAVVVVVAVFAVYTLHVAAP